MRGGWYHTGDVAQLDEQGYLIFVGRNDDVFKSLRQPRAADGPGAPVTVGRSRAASLSRHSGRSQRLGRQSSRHSPDGHQRTRQRV